MKNKHIRDEGTDPMLMPLDELAELARANEFLRGVYHARLALVAGGVLNKDGTALIF